MLLDQPEPVADSIGPLIAESRWQGATGRNGAVVRLHGPVFDRLPDQGRFDFWVNDDSTVEICRNVFD